MKKYYAILLTALLLLLTGCQKTDNIPQTSVSSGSSATNTDIVAWGEVLYSSESQISIDFPAQVENINVSVGDNVKQGTKLITLSTDAYENNIKELQAKVDSAKASADNVDQASLQEQISVLKNQIAYKIKELNNGSSPDLQLYKNALNLAQKEEQQAREDLDKYKTLLKSGAISQSDFNTYSDALNQKSKAVNDAKANIAKTKRALQEAIDSLNISLKTAQVQLNQQKANVTAAQANLDIMSSKADEPYISGANIVSNLASGIVKEINVKRGTIISGQTAQNVISLIDANSIYVSAEVPEEFIGEISATSKVYIVPTSNKNLKITGHITKIPSLAVDHDGDRVVKVQVKPDENSEYIKPGLTSDVHFSRKTA
jgi:multidrug resistance efflux pump